MPQVNLADLSAQELRQRLDSSRARGDAALAYEILREMAARREAQVGRRPLGKRRPAEPRVVDIDLSDPMEKSDELPPLPKWRAPTEAAAAPPPKIEPPAPVDPVEPQPAPPVADTPGPLRLADPAAKVEPPAPIDPAEPKPAPPVAETPEPLRLADPAPAADEVADVRDLELRLRPEALQRARPRPRHGLRVAAGFAVGITSGLALGWWSAGMLDEAPWRAAAPVAAAGQVPEPPPAPAVLDVSLAEPAPAAEAPSTPAAAQPSELDVAAPTAEVAELEPAPEIPAVEAPAPEPTPAAAAAGCAAEPTPADRVICADPALQRLQRELRRAYAEALDAHEERGLLRQRQLAWRDSRNDVSDPDRLARLYEQRIQKLQAATAAAQAQR